MAASSKIEWTDASWTPIRARLWEIQSDGSGKERIGWHCEHASEGCRFCYAEAINLRLGTGFDFKPGNLRGKSGYHGGGNDRPEVFLDETMLLAPLKWKKPRKIFVCSMTDLFADFVKDEVIDKLFAVMALCPQHTFQVLTKRAERMREYMTTPDDGRGGINTMHRIWDVADTLAKTLKLSDEPPSGGGLEVPWPLPNVWLGVSAERQQEADERIPHLLATPAAVRFVSAEPLLGPIDLENLPSVSGIGRYLDALSASGAAHSDLPARLDWIIVGGESGRNARPMHPDWARSLRDQCAAAGVPFFFKQWGQFAPSCYPAHEPPEVVHVRMDGSVRDFPIIDSFSMRPIGKKAAGRLLDGRTHDEFPRVGATR